MPPSLDIILPCYNPRPGWEGHVVDSLRELRSRLGNAVGSMRLYVVDDGSSRKDQIAPEHVEALRTRLDGVELHWMAYEANRGKGYALRTGVQEARGDLQIYTDFDFPFQVRHLAEIFRELAAGNADIVPGVRLAYRTHLDTWNRKFLSSGMRFLNRFILRLSCPDAQAGIKGFNARGRRIFLMTRIDRFLFDTEFLMLAARGDVVVKPIEVELRPEVHFSSMGLKVMAVEAVNFLRILCRAVTTGKV